MQKQKVIIDADPGIDDAMALLLAVNSPELDILGITIAEGNVPTDLGTINALKILNWAQRLDIPVYSGAKSPLKKAYVSAQDTHGDNGLGNADIPPVTDAQPHRDAQQFINEMLMTHRDVTIIALAPLTNIALALKNNPKAWQNIQRFIVMGGTFKSHGNTSPVAEYNFWVDPDAAQYVFDHMPVKVEMVNLDVTRHIVFTPNLLYFVKQCHSEVGELLGKILPFYFDFHWEQEHVIGAVINDPLAIAYAINPDRFARGFDAYTTVCTDGVAIGQSIVDVGDFWRKTPNSYVLTDVDASNFMVFFLSRIIHLPEEILAKTITQIMVEANTHG